jgi:hypothetical protein
MSTGLFAYNYEGQLKDQFSVLHTYDYFIVLDYNITLHVAGSLVVLRDNKMSMYGVYGVLPRNKLTEYQYPCHLKLHEGMRSANRVIEFDAYNYNCHSQFLSAQSRD